MDVNETNPDVDISLREQETSEREVTITDTTDRRIEQVNVI